MADLMTLEQLCLVEETLEVDFGATADAAIQAAREALAPFEQERKD